MKFGVLILYSALLITCCAFKLPNFNFGKYPHAVIHVEKPKVDDDFNDLLSRISSTFNPTDSEVKLDYRYEGWEDVDKWFKKTRAVIVSNTPIHTLDGLRDYYKKNEVVKYGNGMNWEWDTAIAILNLDTKVHFGESLDEYLDRATTTEGYFALSDDKSELQKHRRGENLDDWFKRGKVELIGDFIKPHSILYGKDLIEWYAQRQAIAKAFATPTLNLSEDELTKWGKPLPGENMLEWNYRIGKHALYIGEQKKKAAVERERIQKKIIEHNNRVDQPGQKFALLRDPQKKVMTKEVKPSRFQVKGPVPEIQAFDFPRKKPLNKVFTSPRQIEQPGPQVRPLVLPQQDPIPIMMIDPTDPPVQPIKFLEPWSGIDPIGAALQPIDITNVQPNRQQVQPIVPDPIFYDDFEAQGFGDEKPLTKDIRPNSYIIDPPHHEIEPIVFPPKKVMTSDTRLRQEEVKGPSPEFLAFLNQIKRHEGRSPWRRAGYYNNHPISEKKPLTKDIRPNPFIIEPEEQDPNSPQKKVMNDNVRPRRVQIKQPTPELQSIYIPDKNHKSYPHAVVRVAKPTIGEKFSDWMNRISDTYNPPLKAGEVNLNYKYLGWEDLDKWFARTRPVIISNKPMKTKEDLYQYFDANEIVEDIMMTDISEDWDTRQAILDLNTRIAYRDTLDIYLDRATKVKGSAMTNERPEDFKHKHGEDLNAWFKRARVEIVGDTFKPHSILYGKDLVAWFRKWMLMYRFEDNGSEPMSQRIKEIISGHIQEKQGAKNSEEVSQKSKFVDPSQPKKQSFVFPQKKIMTNDLRPRQVQVKQPTPDIQPIYTPDTNRKSYPHAVVRVSKPTFGESFSNWLYRISDTYNPPGEVKLDYKYIGWESLDKWFARTRPVIIANRPMNKDDLDQYFRQNEKRNWRTNINEDWDTRQAVVNLDEKVDRWEALNTFLDRATTIDGTPMSDELIVDSWKHKHDENLDDWFKRARVEFVGNNYKPHSILYGKDLEAWFRKQKNIGVNDHDDPGEDYY